MRLGVGHVFNRRSFRQVSFFTWMMLDTAEEDTRNLGTEAGLRRVTFCMIHCNCSGFSSTGNCWKKIKNRIHFQKRSIDTYSLIENWALKMFHLEEV